MRDTGAFGDAERGEAGAGLGEKTVRVSVVAAFKFQDEIALGDAARETHRAHGGFGAAGDEADFFDERNGTCDQRGEFEFEFGGDAEAGAAPGLVGDGGADGGIGVAEQDGAPGADEIEKLVAVNVIEVSTFAALDDERVAAHGAEGAHGAVDAADKEFCGAIEDFARAASLAVECWLWCAHDGLTIARETDRGNLPRRRRGHREGFWKSGGP